MNYDKIIAKLNSQMTLQLKRKMLVPCSSDKAKNSKPNWLKLKPHNGQKSKQQFPHWKARSPIWKSNWKMKRKSVCCNRRPIESLTKRSRSFHLTLKMSVAMLINIKNKSKRYDTNEIPSFPRTCFN